MQILMKRLLLVLMLSVIGVVCSAQYHHLHHHLTPYEIALAQENQMLSNIRFDESKLQENPEVWARYQNYLTVNETARVKAKPYVASCWIGLGFMAASLIPLKAWEPNENDSALMWCSGLLTVGSVAAIVGCVGYSVQLSKIKYNKKEFIYYLRTTNNGVGIVSLF